MEDTRVLAAPWRLRRWNSVFCDRLLPKTATERTTWVGKGCLRPPRDRPCFEVDWDAMSLCLKGRGDSGVELLRFGVTRMRLFYVLKVEGTLSGNECVWSWSFSVLNAVGSLDASYWDPKLMFVYSGCCENSRYELLGSKVDGLKLTFHFSEWCKHLNANYYVSKSTFSYSKRCEDSRCNLLPSGVNIPLFWTLSGL